MFEIVSLLTGRLRSTTHDLATSMVIYGVAALFALTAYVALIYGVGSVLSAEYGAPVAAFSIAGATLLAALLVVLILRLRQRRLRRLRRLRVRSASAAGTSAALATMVPMLVRASPVGSLLAVAVLGYVMSRVGQDATRRNR